MKIAFLFPGQGSQTIGLLSSLAVHFPLIEQIFAKASAQLGYDIWELAQQGPSEKLNQTVHTQPILLTAGVALWELWKSQGGKLPVFLAGHSLGEYSAYTCAGTFNFEEAVSLVSKRGQYMQEAVKEGEGAMAAILGLTSKEVKEVCEQACQNEQVSPANYNMLKQIVISGHKTAVYRAMEIAKRKGARLSKIIPVSVPAHCHLMKPAAQRLASDLSNLTCTLPHIPILNNVNANFIKDVKMIQNSLVEQVYQPVRWVESMQWLIDQGIECFIECGPGQVLTGMLKRMVVSKPIKLFSLGEYETFQTALKMVSAS